MFVPLAAVLVASLGALVGHALIAALDFVTGWALASKTAWGAGVIALCHRCVGAAFDERLDKLVGRPVER
jgi:hypothetical protein